MAGERALGVIKYENRTEGKAFFNKQEERLIDMVAALVTNLVISQRIERNRYDRILPIISTTLVSHFDRPSSYEPLLETCRSILSADVCSLFLVDDQGNLMLECIVGISQNKKDQLRGFGYENYKSAKGLTPWILLKSSPFNVRSHPDLRGRSDGHHLGRWDDIIYDGRPRELFKSLYSIPLIIGNEPIGVFKVENKNIPPYYFTESDERLFDLIGRLIAVGVRYAKTRVNEQYLMQMARNVELGFLAAGISHEFNGYLQRMLSTARNTFDTCTDPEGRQGLDKIMAHISDASRVIDIFRSVRASISGVASVDVDEAVKNIIAISRERFDSHDVQIGYKNLGVGRVYLNPGEFQSILINLINNAFDSVVDTSGTSLVQIDIRPDQDDSFTLEVVDSGRGINFRDRNILFAPFFTTKPDGMGIGLFLVQRIVNDMGGKIIVISPNTHGGATFCVNFPSRSSQEESNASS
jgi:signal transduction histidine kinase